MVFLQGRFVAEASRVCILWCLTRDWVSSAPGEMGSPFQPPDGSSG